MGFWNPKPGYDRLGRRLPGVRTIDNGVERFTPSATVASSRRRETLVDTQGAEGAEQEGTATPVAATRGGMRLWHFGVALAVIVLIAAGGLWLMRGSSAGTTTGGSPTGEPAGGAAGVNVQPKQLDPYDGFVLTVDQRVEMNGVSLVGRDDGFGGVKGSAVLTVTMGQKLDVDGVLFGTISKVNGGGPKLTFAAGQPITVCQFKVEKGLSPVRYFQRADGQNRNFEVLALTDGTFDLMWDGQQLNVNPKVKGDDGDITFGWDRSRYIDVTDEGDKLCLHFPAPILTMEKAATPVPAATVAPADAEPTEVP